MPLKAGGVMTYRTALVMPCPKGLEAGPAQWHTSSGQQKHCSKVQCIARHATLRVCKDSTLRLPDLDKLPNHVILSGTSAATAAQLCKREGLVCYLW